MSLLVVSPAYYPSSEIFEKTWMMQGTANRMGLHPFLYGENIQIQTHNQNAQAYDLIPLLESRREDYILSCDCVDVAFLAGEQEIMKKFMTFDTGMVVSAEKDALCGMTATSDILAKRGGYFHNLNIGLWIGERKFAIHCLKESMRLYKDKPELPHYNIESPQAWMGLMLAHGGGPEFELDRDCVLFQSMNLGTCSADVIMEGKRAHNLVTDTYPIALHYNGDKSLVAYRAMVRELLR